MEYRTLGRTGLKVSPLCLGAMTFGASGNPDHDESIRIIHRALDAGVNFVDTADVYSRGESEDIVGRALTGRRDAVVLATKVHGKMGDDPDQQGISRRWIMREVESSPQSDDRAFSAAVRHRAGSHHSSASRIAGPVHLVVALESDLTLKRRPRASRMSNAKRNETGNRGRQPSRRRSGSSREKLASLQKRSDEGCTVPS